jgi:phosphinothricin acetyltransferase
VTDVRAAVPDDLPALTDLYNHYVRSSPVTFDIEEFTVEQRREWFGHYRDTGPHRLMVAVDGEHVLGYATSSIFRVKPAYATSVETTVYCDPDATGRGVGSALYSALFAALADEDVHRAYAGVALPNDASIALHERHGFQVIGTYAEVGRKFGRYWDVRWFERPLP